MTTHETHASVDSERTLEVGAPVDQDARPPQGTTIGRYVILGLVGEGAMGRVLRAYDPKLRREVALKVVRGGSRHSNAEARLLREAHALARLSHPNVVAVYDAEAYERGVAIAMEYVEGRTLRTWLGEKPRTWREVVDVGIAIASGLAAAHAAGLVHRDVKPDNVLVGADADDPKGIGRIRVTDFGLAREHVASVSPRPSDDSDPPQSDPLLTEAGAVVGTPAYMAPELYDGAAADACSDQYALCVLMFEALHGERPFAGGNWVELRRAKRAGPPRVAPTPVPAWLHTTINRGLDPDPQRRWPSVDALRLALGSGSRRGHRGRILLPVAGIAVATVVWLEVRDADRRSAELACASAGASIRDDVWNEDAEASLRAALLATDVSYAGETADKITPWLDAFVDDWERARTDACMDATVHRDPRWTADLLDRAVWCLDERRSDLAALLAELSRADARAIERAVPAAAGLRSVDPCRDDVLLAQLPAPPTSDRAEVDALRDTLSHAAALRAMNALAEAEKEARTAVERADALGWPPLQAQARLMLGRALASLGDFGGAETMLESAYFEAARAGATEVEFDAANQLAHVVATQLHRAGEGLRWTKLADVASTSLPDPAGLRAARQANVLGSVLDEMANYEEAGRQFERSVELVEQAVGPDHPDVARVVGNLGRLRQSTGDYEAAKRLSERSLAINERALGHDHPAVALDMLALASAHYELGDFERSRALKERALEIRRRAFGPDHPEVAKVLVDLGNEDSVRGSYAAAKEFYAKALEMFERAHGPEHMEVANAMSNLGGVYYLLGEYEEARPRLERSLELKEKILGAEHPEIAGNVSNLGGVYYGLGSHAEALALFERALAIRMRALGPDHPDNADTLINVGMSQQALGRHDAARESYARALAIRENAFGRDHVFVAAPMVGLAEVAVEVGDAEEAATLLEAALELYERGDATPREVAWTHFILARALSRSGDRSRAHALAEQARASYLELGDAKTAAEVAAWLASVD